MGRPQSACSLDGAPRGLEWLKWFLGVAWLLLAFGANARGAQEHVAQSGPLAPPQSYVRQVVNTNGTIALKVAVRKLRPVHGSGPTIWLVGVTHLGSARYYARLQRLLDARSLVLFEGVGATNKQFRLHGDQGFSIQEALANALGLKFQLDAINYDQPNFRNSDLTLTRLAHILAPAAQPVASPKKGVPGAKAEFSELISIMRGTGLFGGLARIMVAIVHASPRLQAATKVTLIEMLGHLTDDLTQLSGLPPDMHRLLKVLIEERNKKVLSDLGTALRSQPRPRSVALFYGAGHMMDLERRVRETYRYAPAKTLWFTAFAVNPRAAGLSQFELNLVRRWVQSELRALHEPTGATASP